MSTTLSGERNVLRSVINNIPDPIFVKDSEGRYILDNVAHRQSVEKRHEEEIIGQPFSTSFPKRRRKTFGALTRQSFKAACQ